MPFKPSACARACRRRGSSSDGKYVPWRSLGIASSIVPTRVSHSRSRTPLRDVTRLSVRSYGAAPIASVTSASISSWVSSRSPSRRNCGSLPCSSLRSRSKSAILKLVIVVVLPSVDSATHLEPHGGPFCQRAPEFTPLLATQLCGAAKVACLAAHRLLLQLRRLNRTDVRPTRSG